MEGFYEGLGGHARTLTVPAETGRRDTRLERRLGQAVGWLGLVVARRRDVVGCVGVEERRQVLDVAAAHAELVLATAVGRDPALVAVVVGTEQLRQASEARRL